MYKRADNSLIVTNYRIRKQKSSNGFGYISILLYQITSIVLVNQEKKQYLGYGFAGLAIAVMAVYIMLELAIIALAIGIGFFIQYFLSKTQKMIIKSPTGSIQTSYTNDAEKISQAIESAAIKLQKQKLGI